MKKIYDAVIVGGGPAGLSAAIYLARAQFHVLVVEREKIGGQITITADVVNYPGIVETDGPKLTEQMRIQAENFGADFLMADVTGLHLDGDYKTVHTNRGDISCLGIVFAAGARPRLAGFRGEKEFQGHGVTYCATCDGEFFTGKDIFVVGGGFAAVEEGLFLTRYGKKVIMLVRSDDFTCETPAVDEIRDNPKVEIYCDTEVTGIGGDSMVRSVDAVNRKTGKKLSFHAADGENYGVFVFAGYEPASELLKGKVALDSHGYILTDANQKTDVDGVYAAGDICVKELRQVVTAVSDGAVAATSLEKHLSQMYRSLGLKREPLAVKKSMEKKSAQEKPQTGTARPGAFLDDSMRQALAPVFERFEHPVVIRSYTDDSNMTAENKEILEELKSMTDKIRVEYVPAPDEDHKHTLSICDESGHEKGLRFHGVPGGHEFNSFVLALYNAAGPGQSLDGETEKRIRDLNRPVKLKIAVSLSCTMCPDLVAAAQRIAADNPHVETDVYDLQHYPDMQKKYNIMSVPCMVINDETVEFGKKSVPELLDLMQA